MRPCGLLWWQRTKQRWHMNRTIIAAVLLFVASPALADSQGGDLIAACNTKPSAKAHDLCLGYLHGYMDGVLIEKFEQERGTPICIPPTTTNDQLRDAVITFGKSHSETLYFETQGFVAAALLQTFPCKNSN